MREQIISFETDKLAKEKGFEFKEDEDSYKYSGYYKYGKIGNGEWSLESVYDIETLHWGSELTEIIDTPTQSLLQKWLREKNNIVITIASIYEDQTCQNIKYWWYIQGHEEYKGGEIYCKTYEEVLEIALKKGLKLI